MKILYHIYGDVVGGAETQLQYLIKHINKDHQVAVTYSDMRVSQFVKDLGVSYYFAYSPNTLIKAINAFKPQIIQYYHTKLMYKALSKGGYKGAKVVEIAHNAHHFSFDCTTYPKDLTDIVVCVSGDAQKNFKKAYPDFPTEVITNGVDTDIFKPVGDKPKRPKLLGGFCGRFESRGAKGVDMILDHMETFKNEIDFELVGYDLGNWKRRIDIRKIPNITIKRYTKDIIRYYNKWDFFLSCSPREGFGLAIAEALSCGLPTVVYNCGGICNYIEHGNHAFIANTKEEVAEGIRSVIDGATYNPLGVDFSAKTMAGKYAELYQNLAG